MGGEKGGAGEEVYTPRGEGHWALSHMAVNLHLYPIHFFYSAPKFQPRNPDLSSLQITSTCLSFSTFPSYSDWAFPNLYFSPLPLSSMI